MTKISQGALHVAYSTQGVGSCEVSRGSSSVTQCQAAGNSFAGLAVHSSDCLVGVSLSPHNARATGDAYSWRMILVEMRI